MLPIGGLYVTYHLLGNQKQLLIIGFGQVIRNNNDGEAGVGCFRCEFNGDVEPQVMFVLLLW